MSVSGVSDCIEDRRKYVLIIFISFGTRMTENNEGCLDDY